MRYEFHLRSSGPALAAMGDRKQQILTDIVQEAEKLPLENGDYAIFDVHALKLKVIVQFSSHTIMVLTEPEYHRTDIPGSVRRN